MPLSRLVNTATPGDTAHRSATWQANTAYKAGEIVVNNSLIWQANADFTSGASFSASNWTLISATEIAEMPLSTTTALTTTLTAVSGWQVVVPANSGPATLRCANMLFTMVMGTNGTGIALYVDVELKDELGTVLADSQWRVVPTGTTGTHANTLHMEQDVANNASSKTYSVWVKIATTANGASANLLTSQSGFTDPTLKAIRR